MTHGRRGTLALAAAVLFTCGAPPAGAMGAAGSLSNPSCFEVTGSLASCSDSTAGLSRARGVAITPNGASLYATAWLDEAIVKFDRDPVTGVLSNPSCIEDMSSPVAGCGVFGDGLEGAGSVAISPTGNSVYVGAFNSEALVRFNRNTTTGALSHQGCFEHTGGPAACTTTVNGLLSPHSVVVSPDGLSVYVASGSVPSGGAGDNAIVRFNRDAAGALSSATCIEDPGLPDAGCGAMNTTEGLDGAISVAISPTGNSVYVASNIDGAIVRFNRNAAGALSSPSCIEDPAVPDAGCGAGNTAEGLDGAAAVAVSPDGQSVYVASRTDNAIVRFNRDAAGALSGASCIEDPPIDEGCGASAEGLAGATGVTVSPMSDSVHVASFAQGLTGDNAVVSFGRAPGGALTNLGCFEDPPLDEGCGASADVAGAFGISVGPESRSLYVASELDDTITRFDRELAAPPAPPATPAVDPPPETTIGKGPKRKSRARRPSFTFGSNEPGSSFLCNLAGKRVPAGLRAFAPCASPLRYPRLSPGKKSFQVLAVDPAGNADPTPALLAFKILP